MPRGMRRLLRRRNRRRVRPLYARRVRGLKREKIGIMPARPKRVLNPRVMPPRGTQTRLNPRVIPRLHRPRSQSTRLTGCGNRWRGVVTGLASVVANQTH